MDQSTFNHGKSGDTNPKGRSRSPLLELYTRSLRNEREEKIGHRTSAACGGGLRLCYTLDEGKESERETTNCPPKRVRSRPGRRSKPIREREAWTGRVSRLLASGSKSGLSNCTRNFEPTVSVRNRGGGGRSPKRKNHA